MKRFTMLILIYTIFTPAFAAVLSCEVYLAKIVHGASSVAVSGILPLTRSYEPTGGLRGTSAAATVSLSSEMVNALRGNRFKLYASNNRLTSVYLVSESMEILPGIETYYMKGDLTYPFEPEFSFIFVTLTDYNGFQHRLNPVKMSMPFISGSGSLEVTRVDGNIDIIDVEIGIESDSKTTDSISFPEQIDVGMLSFGQNTSDDSIQYSVNTNEIPVNFTTNNSQGSSFTVNGMIAQNGQTYAPPFHLGIYLHPDAAPGTHTSIVNATWTCP
ncbi:hypothetical protein AB8780_08025 [Enterobacter sp. SAT-E-asb]|uniref:hypothetical protein n=1 Tax=Enterobacter sp. SAT-E-asb TaxID=3241615 RepID=UPI003530C147